VVTLGDTTATLPADLTDGGWHHLALVEEGARAVLYLDGVEAGLVTAPFGAATATALTLGRGFVGELDEVRVWSAARTPAELAAWAQRPLGGREPGLVGLWRMDEGSGLELFDGSPSHLDGAVTLVDGASPTPAPFTASTAWSTRRATSGLAIDPAAVGYDPDGDTLTLTMTSAPTHGDALPDADLGLLGYQSQAGFVGTDAIGFRLEDGLEAADGRLELVVDRAPYCETSSDCGGAGEVCVQGTCLAGSSIDARSGGCGCTTGGGGALALWSSLALLTIRRRRPRAATGRPPGRSVP